MDSMGSGTRTRVTARVLLVALLVATTVISGCGALAELEGGDSGATEERGVALSPGPAPDYDYAQDDAVSPVPPESGGTGEDASKVPAEDRLVIRNVGMRLRVDEVDEAVQRLRTITTDAGGTMGDLQISTDDSSPVYRYEASGTLGDGAALSAYATVRVPADKLEEFSDQVAGLGEVVRQSASESDVTQEHVDLSARLKNLEAEEVRLREFFDSAKSTTDMLAIERELARVRGEIESLQAQVAYLERQSAMATVVVEFIGPEAVIKPAGEDWGFVDALRTSVRAMVGTINVLIVLLGGALPLIVLGLIAFFVARALIRRRRRLHPRPAPQATAQYWSSAAATQADDSGSEVDNT